jgi:hypothetical protein
VRRKFLDTDLVGLGFGGVSFPEYEYDTEADLAMSWLANGASPSEAAARAARYIERDWGVSVPGRKVEQLARALHLLNSRPGSQDYQQAKPVSSTEGSSSDDPRELVLSTRESLLQPFVACLDSPLGR